MVLSLSIALIKMTTDSFPVEGGAANSFLQELVDNTVNATAQPNNNRPKIFFKIMRGGFYMRRGIVIIVG